LAYRGPARDLSTGYHRGMITHDTLAAWLARPEGERLEFKEARRAFSYREVHEYLVALANEGGGHLVLGVTNAIPRTVVGTDAVRDHARQVHELNRQLGQRVEVSELHLPEGRVVVIGVGPRPVGQPLSYRGRYLMRAGESTVAMTPDQLQAVFAERVVDPSALAIGGASPADLDAAAVEVFRALWAGKTERTIGRDRAAEIRVFTPAEVIRRAGLAIEDEITLAALVLLGQERAIRRLLPNHEIIYEYRDRPGSIEARVRRNLRRAFFLVHDELWGLVDARNPITEIPAGFLRTGVAAFNELSVREAVLNAVAHRDYGRPESIFLRHDPQRFVIESPGGFPPTVTPENVLDRQVPRNRLIAESLERAGFVERSGQGADIMFREAVREAKPLPSFEGTDATRVRLTLSSAIRDPELVRAMDAIVREDLEVLDARDFLVVDHVARDGRAPTGLQGRVQRLVDIGVLEARSRGKYGLSQRLYAAGGRRGDYTRARGLDRLAQLELIIQHLRQTGDQGAPIGEIMQIFPHLTRFQVFGLLDQLREEHRAHVRGVRRTARWFVGAGDSGA
jgi:ATP-dependent DNA helicase RecG